MSDKQPSLRSRIALRLFGHPGVLWPTAGGVAGALAYALFLSNPWLLLVSAGAGAVGVGFGFWRLMFRKDAIAQEMINEIRDQTQEAHRAERAAFRAKLASDHHVQDEQLFDELCELEDAFLGDKDWYEDADPSLVANVLARFKETFESSLKLLDKAFGMRQRAERLRGDVSRELHDASDRLLTQVKAGIEELGRIYAGVQKLSISRMTGPSADQSDHKASLAELKEELASAERAEERRQMTIIGMGEPDYSEYETEGSA